MKSWMKSWIGDDESNFSFIICKNVIIYKHMHTDKTDEQEDDLRKAVAIAVSTILVSSTLFTDDPVPENTSILTAQAMQDLCRNRKGWVSQNVLGVCDFNIKKKLIKIPF